jgi:serine/threonine-protein kinase RsbW
VTDTVPVQSSPQPIEQRDVVAITLPATGAYLSVLRTATAALAARLDFTLDEIEDLRIAVDEACAQLLVHAVPGTSVHTSFEAVGSALAVAVTVDSLTGQPPATDTFAWTVLTALTDGVDSSVDEHNRVTITLDKRRTARGAP